MFKHNLYIVMQYYNDMVKREMETISTKKSLESYLETHLEQISELQSEVIKLHAIIDKYLEQKGLNDTNTLFLIMDTFSIIQSKLDLLYIAIKNTRDYVRRLEEQ